MPISPTPPRVLISYSHDSVVHRERVLALADRLRHEGVDCQIDRYNQSPPEGWPRWMKNVIEWADFVLVASTEIYRRRFDGREVAGFGLGAAWEGAIITQELYQAARVNTKFIPILFDRNDRKYIPIELDSDTHYLVDSSEGYESLYRRITSQPEIDVPPIGDERELLPMKRPGLERLFEVESKGNTKPTVADEVVHNLPFPPNPSFGGRVVELRKLVEALEEKKNTNAARMVAIHGLGGIGKTELIIEYAWKHAQNGKYKYILWLEAHDGDSLDVELAALSAMIGLESLEPEQGAQLNAVLEWFSAQKQWLLILDNVDAQEGVAAVQKRLRPRMDGDIIITSRIAFWPPEIKDIQLDYLSIEDGSYFLLRRCLHDESVNDARALAEALGCLPLALAQAAAFICETKYLFADYLIAFNKNREILLNENALESRRYPFSVAQTWVVTIGRLSAISRLLLNAAAWCAPDNIPRHVFTSGAFRKLIEPIPSEIAIDKSLAELARFSLIKLTAKTVSVHRLLQAVEQDFSFAKNSHCESISTMAALLYEAAPQHHSHNVGVFKQWNGLRPHVEVVLAALQKYNIRHILAAMLSNLFGVFLMGRGKYISAEGYCRWALTLFEEICGPNDPRTAEALSVLATVLESRNQTVEAQSLHYRALGVFEKMDQFDDRYIAAINNLAFQMEKRDQLEASEQLYRRAVLMFERIPDAYPEGVILVFSNYALLLNKLGRMEEAEVFLRRAINTGEAIFGKGAPHMSRLLNDLGYFLLSNGRFSDAEMPLRRCLQIGESILDKDDIEMAPTMSNLGSVLRHLKKHSESEVLLRRALAIEEASGGRPPSYSSALVNLAILLSETDRNGEAERLLRRAVKVDEETLGSAHSEVALDLVRLGRVVFSMGRIKQAKELVQRAVAIFDGLKFIHPEADVAMELLLKVSSVAAKK